MKQVDMLLFASIRDPNTGETINFTAEEKDLYVNDGKVRFPKIVIDISEKVDEGEHYKWEQKEKKTGYHNVQRGTIKPHTLS